MLKQVVIRLPLCLLFLGPLGVIALGREPVNESFIMKIGTYTATFEIFTRKKINGFFTQILQDMWNWLIFEEDSMDANLLREYFFTDRLE